MTRSCLGSTVLVASALLTGCIGIEHEDIGGSGSSGTDGGSFTTTGGEGDGDGDGDGEEGTGSKFDILGGDGDGDGEGGSVPRLFLAGADGVSMWEAGAALQNGSPADGGLPTGEALALALGDDTLFVARTDAQIPLQLYTSPGSLVDMDGPADGVGVTTGFGDVALTTVAQMQVDASDDLWVVDDGVRLFTAASALAMDSAPDARFIADPSGIVSAAHDAVGGKLLGAHTSMGVAMWDAPLAAMGENNLPGSYLDGGFAARWTLIAGGDLFVASGDDAFVRVWQGIDGIAAPVAPDVTLGAAVTGLASPVHLYARGTRLVVTDDSGGGRVLIWDDAASLSTDQAPDHTIGEGDLSAPTQAILAHDDRLYVRDGTEFVVYADALGVASLQATVDAQLGATADMVLLECRQDADCSGTCLNGTCL